MTSLFDKNENAATMSIEQATYGPRVGFAEGFEQAYESQWRTSSMYGIERAVGDIQQEQMTKLYKAGASQDEISPWTQSGFTVAKAPLDPLSPTFGLGRTDPMGMKLAKFYEEGGDEETAQHIADYDSRIESLKKKYPDLGLLNSREIWDSVRTKAQESEQLTANMRTSTSGGVGEFLGGAVSSMDPRTDPFNFYTAAIGGAGKNAATRIASQAGAQGVIETVNQATGVQEERRLLGLESGFGDAATRVAFAAAGGGVLQGGGEALAATARYAGRRWFRNTPDDPAPPPPIDTEIPAGTKMSPEDLAADNKALAFAEGRMSYDKLNMERDYGASRHGAARVTADLSATSRVLDAWDGPKPSDMKAIDLGGYEEFMKMQPRTVDEAARIIDPDTFRVYDKLAERKQELRAQIDIYDKTIVDKVSPTERASIMTALDDLANKIDDLQAQVDAGGISNRKIRDIQKRIDKLTEEGQDYMVRLNDDIEVSGVRNELIATDQKMSSMAEVVSRAYARANNEWRGSPEQRAAIRKMIRSGQRELPPEFKEFSSSYKPADDSGAFSQKTIDKAPILQQAYKVEGQMRPDADAVDYAKTIVREDMKRMDEVMEKFRAEMGNVLKEEGGEIHIAGTELKLKLDGDKIYVPNDNGSGGTYKTVRELLEETREAELDLEATKKCSI